MNGFDFLILAETVSRLRASEFYNAGSLEEDAHVHRDTSEMVIVLLRKPKP